MRFAYVSLFFFCYVTTIPAIASPVTAQSTGQIRKPTKPILSKKRNDVAIRTIRVRNINVKYVYYTLSHLFGNVSYRRSNMMAPFSSKVNFAWHQASNSIVVVSNQADYTKLKKVIESLDIKSRKVVPKKSVFTTKENHQKK